MKRLPIIFLVLICLLGLGGCDPLMNYLDKDDLLENTVKIELVDYENENPKLLNVNAKKKPTFDFNKATLIAEIDESRYEDILTGLTKGGYTYYGTALNEPMGKTMVIYQQNGNMIVIFGCAYTNERNDTRYYGGVYIFDKDGVLVEYIGNMGHHFSEQVTSLIP